jgi:hypothetical protein
LAAFSWEEMPMRGAYARVASAHSYAREDLWKMAELRRSAIRNRPRDRCFGRRRFPLSSAAVTRAQSNTGYSLIFSSEYQAIA